MAFPTPRDALQGNPPTPDYRPRKTDLVNVLDQMQTIAAVEMLKDFHGAVGEMPAVGNTIGDKRAVLQPAASGGGVYRWTGVQWDLVAALPLSLTDSMSAQEAAASLAATILQANRAELQAGISTEQAGVAANQVALAAAQVVLATLQANNAGSSAVSSAGSAGVAQASAEASGDIAFFDSKSAADTALSGLPTGQIVEVMQDESRFNGRARYRVEGAALAIKLDLSIDAVPTVAALKTIVGIYDGQVARVVSNRQFGHFKWTAGNLSAFVTADPFGGIYVAPNSAPSGATGAWVRQVERSEYDAEWWLPDDMPTNAQLMINSGINVLPADARRFLFPVREVLQTGSIRFTKGITYEGFSEGGPLNGQGGQFFNVIAQANNALLKRIKAGNVAGQLGLGEPGCFHVNDGTTSNNAAPTEKVTNVGIEDCEGYDAETGIRFGYSSSGGYPNLGSTVASASDCWATNFRARGIERIGIEYFHAYDIEVRNPRIRMKAPSTIIGFDRLMRLANAKKITVIGGYGKGPVDADGVSNGNCVGLSCENADNVIFEGIRLENFTSYIRADQSENVTASGVQGIGWSNSRPSDFFTVEVRAGTINRNFKLHGCAAINIGVFARLHGAISGLAIENSDHIDNESSTRHFLIGNGNGQGKAIVIKGNRHYSGAPTNGQSVRLPIWNEGSQIILDDNDFSGSISVVGNGDVFTKGPGSNRNIGTDLWAIIRPPVSQGDFNA